MEKTLNKASVVVHACNLRSQKAEAGGLRVQGLGYIARPKINK
jgi:hypothetical protein